MRISSRGVPALLLVAACGTTPARPNPPVVSSASPAPPRPVASASTAAPASASAAVAPEAPPDDEVQNNLAGTIDTDGPPAPCDFARNYRGKIGEDPLSITLSRSGAAVRGFSAYDAGFGDIELSGTVEADGALVLAERKDGKDTAALRGRCASETGIVTGTWTQGAVTRPFTWRPREAGGAALSQKVRRFPKQPSESCQWDVRSPVVFGLGDAARTTRINGLLKVRFPGMNEDEMERKVTRCAPGGDNQVQGWYSVEANTNGLLSVVESGYVYLGPQVHGDFGAAEATISVDVPSGRAITVGDVVTSSKALRPVVASCMKFFAEKIGGDEWWFERDIQGVPADENGEPVEETSPAFVPKSLHDPSILVLPDGLAVLLRNQPTVSAQLALRGPVIRWGALLRAGVLKASSPVARLWAGEKKAGESEPACVRVFEPRWLKSPKG